MNEVKKILKRMAIYYLLFAVKVIPAMGVVSDRFPTRNMSTIYLLVLSVCLVLYYFYRVSPTGWLSFFMKSLSVMGLLLIVLQGVKYSALSEVGVLARHTWYLYYVPILLLPLFLFYISLLVFSKDDAHLPKAWYVPLAVTVVLIALVLTNDLHRQVFDFQPDFLNWDGEYSHGWLFYVVTAWQLALYLAALAILIARCRVGTARKNAWIFLIPVAIGVMMCLLLTDTLPVIRGANVIELPEVYFFTTTVVLECCMQLGLIPTNTDYGKLFREVSLSAQITDKAGAPVYASASAVTLTSEQFASESGSRIDEHTVLHKISLPGGFGFWQDDMTELDRLNQELEEAKEGLAEETELIRLRNELQEKQTKIEQRTQMYDAIARRTQKQSQAISQYAEAARESDDLATKDFCRRRIVLLGAYIKRYANLMLLSRESDRIQVGELGLSVSEVLRILNYCGIPGEYIGDMSGTMDSAAALAVFEAFGTLVETNVSSLSGVFVRLTANENVRVKVTLEDGKEQATEGLKGALAASGVRLEISREDNVTYVCFTAEGGEG